MLVNKNTGISSSKVLLVPYCSHHVPRYHEWMKDPEIQIATASEPLTLEEEYSMQRSWRYDADKLTFITCLPLSSSLYSPEKRENGTAISVDPTHDDAPERMLGDVNLFLKYADEDDEDDGILPAVVGEIELMIAEKVNQRRGFGRASLICFLRYIVAHEREILHEFLSGQNRQKAREEKFAYLVVRIGATNVRSLALFESIGFQRVREEPNYFGELELRLYGVQEHVITDLMERYEVKEYDEVLYDPSD
ncbi:hypothetical protein VTO42DRAFT_3840 [Malbranchea cinnamomea]